MQLPLLATTSLINIPPNNRNDKLPFIRRRGEGGAYIDRTVDKASFVIFVMKSVASLSVVRQNHALSKVILNLFKTFKLGNKIK